MSPLPSRVRYTHREFLLLALLPVALLLVPGCLRGGLGPGEKVIFFPSAAHRDADGDWLVPVNGWVWEPRLSDRTFLFFSRFLKLDEFVKNPEERAVLRDRIHYFIVDNKTGRRVEVIVAGRGIRLAKSSEDGLFTDRIVVPAEAVPTTRPESDARVRWLTYRTVGPGKGKYFEGRVQLLEPTGLSIISDIDDTIRVTEVKDTKRMIERTFLEPMEPVAGMPAVYRHWAETHGAAFHYVSASPYQLYEPLSALVAQEYPQGSMDLRMVRYEGSTLKFFIELMESPPEWKLERIEPFLRIFPRREFVLVGDSGQNDPEVYAQLARNHPDQVRAILIRDVTREDANSERYQKTFDGLPRSKWRIFRDPAEIRDALEAARKFSRAGTTGDTPHDGNG